MKPYAFALILVRFLALGFAIYFSTVLASTYITLTNSSVKGDATAMSMIQSISRSPCHDLISYLVEDKNGLFLESCNVKLPENRASGEIF